MLVVYPENTWSKDRKHRFWPLPNEGNFYDDEAMCLTLLKMKLGLFIIRLKQKDSLNVKGGKGGDAEVNESFGGKLIRGGHQKIDTPFHRLHGEE